LSTDIILSPFEKIHLARTYKVAAWLYEGITGLVNSNPGSTLEDLATLGWETAAWILWIRDNSPHCQSPMPANTLYFRRDTIQCGACPSPASLITGNYNCPFCGQAVPADTELTTVARGPGSEASDLLVPLKAIKCNNIQCQRPIFSSTSFYCRSCFLNLIPDNFVRITPKRGLKESIEEIFGEEIRNYEFT